MKNKEKPKYSMWQSICFMLRYAWKYRKRVLWFCIILAVLEVGINLTQLYIAPVILQKVEQTVPLGELLGTIGLFILALILLKGLQKYVDENARFPVIDIRTQIVNDLNEKSGTTSYPNTLDPSFIRKRDKSQNVTNSNDKSGEYIWTTIRHLLINLLGFSFYIILLSNVNWILVIVTLVISVISFPITNHIDSWGYRHSDEEEGYWVKAEYIGQKMTSIPLAKDIRIFGLQEWLSSVWNSVLGLMDAFVKRREKVYIWINVLDIVFSLARNSIAYAYLIHLTLSQGLPASEFLLYFTAITGFTTWVTGILREFYRLHGHCLDLSIVQEFLNYPEVFHFEGGKPIPKSDEFELKLENVSFRYPSSDEYVIKNLNLTIRQAEKLAVVGLNGAGKTTLIKLLCGFYDPDEGRVLLNGIDIREFNRREYYQLFSAVFQECSPMEITIAENVAQDYENIDYDRVADCIEKAGLTKAVTALSKGLNTPVGREVFLDGVLFSGGQIQRLMLARALYKDGSILVLDEPTAALDPLAEHDIYMKYNEMTAGKTSIFISHRLASTRFCDRIIFLEDGVITEEGTHGELLAKNGGYAKLFDVQSRYYQEGRNL